MRIKKGYVIKRLAGWYVVVTVGEVGREFNGLIRMNETGAFIWNAILNGADTKEKVLSAMMSAYEDLDEVAAREDLDFFMKTAETALED